MIANRPQNIPTTPGIYFFKNSAGEIIYVGKSGNLKNRLSSYFNRSIKEPKTVKMLEEAAKVEWQELDSEIEALIMEAEQIKIHEPRYNIALRDGKQYSYVAFTNDVFARIYVTHQPLESETVIGPFTDAGALRTTLKYLRRIFPYCTCKNYHRSHCFNYHIGKCPGFCCLNPKGDGPTATEEQIEQYKENVKAVKDLLNGRKKTLVKNIESEMDAAASEENFEKAIELRERLEKVRAVFENARVIKEISNRYDALAQIKKTLRLPAAPQRIEGYDISNIQGRHATGSMIVFTDGNPDKEQYRKFQIRTVAGADDTAMLREIISRRFKHPEWQYPDLIIVDGGKAQLNAVKKTINSRLAGVNIPIIGLTKNQKHAGDHIYLSNKKTAVSLKRLADSVRNLILHVDTEAHRFAVGYYRKLHRRAGF